MKLSSTLLSLGTVCFFASTATAERGSDGHVKILFWQAPSTLNPFQSGGAKDNEAASLVLEPLGRYDPNGALVPYLAQHIPTVANGGVANDLTSITWTLKPDLMWSDGTPVTSEDVKFSADYCMHPEAGCSQLAKFDGVETVEIIDAYTVKVNFAAPRPNPYGPFMGGQSPILQKAQFQDCLGARAIECVAQNFAPIGTGPFTVKEFRPNDVISFEANPNYRDATKPAFETLTLKGGGDATAAGRAVLETGEFDYAWNLQLAPDVLAKMADVGIGKPIAAFGTTVERLEMNLTDPNPDLDKNIRATREAPHPFLTDMNVRKALSMAIDRSLLVEIGYGPTGRPTCNLVPGPAYYASDNTACLTQDIAGANRLLDAAGWVRGTDGVRTKDGQRLSILFQTSTNNVRQEFQALIKHWWNELGVETELRNINASIYFGADANSPDTFQKFYADVAMHANNYDGTDPQTYLAMYRCGNEPKPSRQWQGENINRFCDPAYDTLIDTLSQTSDLETRYDLAKRMNDMLTKDSYVVVPLIDRGRVSAHANSLGGVLMNSWDSELWNIADWHRIE